MSSSCDRRLKDIFFRDVVSGSADGGGGVTVGGPMSLRIAECSSVLLPAASPPPCSAFELEDMPGKLAKTRLQLMAGSSFPSSSSIWHARAASAT